jgi:uncharacterized protein involved in exopolysaccharide biosynthesis
MHPVQSSQQNLTATPDDEISLWDIIEIIRESWRLIATLSIGSAAIALGLCLVWPKQYEARGLVKVAKIGNLQAALNGAATPSAPVESNAVVIQRLKSQAFQSRLLKLVGGDVSLEASEPQGSGLVEIVARGASVDAATNAVTASVQMIAQEHTQVVESSQKSLMRSLESTKQELGRTSEILKTMVNQSAKLARQDSSLALMIGQMQSALISQQNELNERLLRLEFAMSPVNAVPTGLLEAVAGSDQPVVPETHLVTVLAFLAGGFMGILAAFLRHAWRTRPTTPIKQR